MNYGWGIGLLLIIGDFSMKLAITYGMLFKKSIMSGNKKQEDNVKLG